MSKQLLLSIIDRTGDTKMVLSRDKASIGSTVPIPDHNGEIENVPIVDLDKAYGVMKAEFGNGRWLRVVDEQGLSSNISDVTEFTPERFGQIFDNAAELGMMLALQGGRG